MDQRTGLDLSSYIEEKAKGQTVIVKLNGTVFYSKKQFDPDTGAAKPVLLPVEEAAMVEKIAQEEAKLKIYKQFLADIRAAQEKLSTT